MCCATSSASSGSAPAGVVLAKTFSRASGLGRKLRSAFASAGPLFDDAICCSTVSSISAGVGGGGCCCDCCCDCCWVAAVPLPVAPLAAASVGCPAAGGVAAAAAVAAGAAGSAVCGLDGAAAALVCAGIGVADADVDGGVGRLLSVAIVAWV